MNSAIKFKLQPCIYVQSACTTVDSAAALLLLSACVERMTKKLCASCAVFCFPSSYSLQPLSFLFYSSLHPCALILLDNIKIAPAREKKRTSNPPTTKKRAWLLPIVSPRPASQQRWRQVYIYTLVLKPARNRAGHVKWNVLLLRIDA